jgi:hypothetical protein
VAQKTRATGEEPRGLTEPEPAAGADLPSVAGGARRIAGAGFATDDNAGRDGDERDEVEGDGGGLADGLAPAPAPGLGDGERRLVPPPTPGRASEAEDGAGAAVGAAAARSDAVVRRRAVVAGGRHRSSRLRRGRAATA